MGSLSTMKGGVSSMAIMLVELEFLSCVRDIEEVAEVDSDFDLEWELRDFECLDL